MLQITKLYFLQQKSQAKIDFCCKKLVLLSNFTACQLYFDFVNLQLMRVCVVFHLILNMAVLWFVFGTVKKFVLLFFENHFWFMISQ